MQKLQTNDFELNFLDGWRDASQVILVGPERPLFTPNLQVHREAIPDGQTAEDFFREQRSELTELDGFRLLEHGDTKVGGEPALFHAYSWDLPNVAATRIRQSQHALTHAGTLFTITCSALEHEWEQHDAAFALALAGFRWR